MTPSEKQKITAKRSKNKPSSHGAASAKREAALNLDLWDGDNVIMSKAMVNGIHRLDINGKRVAGLAMSQIEQRKHARIDDIGCWSIDLYAKDFSSTFQINPDRVYQDMLQGSNELLKAVVTLHSTDKASRQPQTDKMPWMQHIQYIKGVGKISLKFNLLLTPHITRFVSDAGGGYALYKITQAGRLRSAYAWRLFELCSQFRDTGWMTVEIGDLHERLETSSSMRKNFAKFKVNCLNPIVQELRDKCKMDVKYEAIKEGRRYTKVKFSFRDDPEFVLQKRASKAAPATPVKDATPETPSQAVKDDDTLWHVSKLDRNPYVDKPASSVYYKPTATPLRGEVPVHFPSDEEDDLIPF